MRCDGTTLLLRSSRGANSYLLLLAASRGRRGERSFLTNAKQSCAEGAIERSTWLGQTTVWLNGKAPPDWYRCRSCDRPVDLGVVTTLQLRRVYELVARTFHLEQTLQVENISSSGQSPLQGA